VRLSVYASNDAALRIYVRRGFLEISREPVEVLGVQDERIVMLSSLDMPALPAKGH
jgi:ribosomal protein S18 acetylase RimI-like enzyme